MNASTTVLIVLVSFGLGSIPTGLLVTRRLGDLDLRQAGSGNIGATNVYREFGWKWAVVVFLGDMAKGLLPVLIARGMGLSPYGSALAALLSVCGHIFNPWLGFKGGKGVATAFGAMLGVSPLSAMAALLVWGGVVWRTRIVSLASLAAAGTLPVAAFVVLWDHAYHLHYSATALILAGLVAWAHRENIQRLRSGEEKPVSRKD